MKIRRIVYEVEEETNILTFRVLPDLRVGEVLCMDLQYPDVTLSVSGGYDFSEDE